MGVGAIVTVPGAIQEEDLALQDRARPQYLFQAFSGRPVACYEILGETLLQRTLNALRDAGIQQRAVLTEDSGSESLFPSRVRSFGKYFSAWEKSVEQQLEAGVEILFLIRMGAYLELDFTEVLEFHRQSCGVLTQIYDQKRALDVAVVNTSQLRGDTGSYRGRLSSLIPYHKRYHFAGYTNRLREPQDLRQLAHEALLGRNSIRPLGQEVSPEVWLGRRRHRGPQRTHRWAGVHRCSEPDKRLVPHQRSYEHRARLRSGLWHHSDRFLCSAGNLSRYWIEFRALNCFGQQVISFGSKRGCRNFGSQPCWKTAVNRHIKEIYREERFF